MTTINILKNSKAHLFSISLFDQDVYIHICIYIYLSRNAILGIVFISFIRYIYNIPTNVYS